MEASCWERLTVRKAGSCSDGQAMLSKSLIQFSIDEWGCAPSLFFDLRLETFFKRTCTGSLVFSAPTPQHAIVNPRFRQRLLDTHRQVWVSLLCGHCFFLLAPGAHKVLFVPSKSLFPQSCGSSTIKSQWPPNSHFLRVLSPFARSPGWAICCVSRAFLTVQEFIWYNFCAVCGSSTQQLYGRANGDLLQEGLCHTI